MLIKVDYRDAELHSKCAAILASDVEKYSCIQLVKENIPLGDVIIIDEKTGKEKIIVERKSLTDLAASIRDGRYAEQSFRLNECSMHNHTIYYAIEGDLRTYKPFCNFNNNKGSVNKKSLLSAMVSISYFKGFSVHRTINIDETAEWIVQFAVKLHKEGSALNSFYVAQAQTNVAQAQTTVAQAQTNVVEPNVVQAQTNLAQAQTTVEGEPAYSDVCKNNRIKKNNITPENIGAIMLSQIPNVSSTTASVIIEKFGDINSLMIALKESKTALDMITITNKDGKSRKISKPSIANIYKFLIPNNF